MDVWELEELKKRLQERLQALASERRSRQDLLTDRDGNRVLAWRQHEILGMYAAVNDERAALGKPPADITAVVTAERLACGHVDYADKWPWYCAEIVHGVFSLAPEVVS